MWGMASVTKENSDSDLAKKRVSAFTVHMLQVCAYILSEKSILCLRPSFAAPRIGRHSAILRASGSCSHSFLQQASPRGSESGTHVFWCQVSSPSSFDPGPEQPSDVDKNLGPKPRQKPQASFPFLCSPLPKDRLGETDIPSFHTNSCHCK